MKNPEIKVKTQGTKLLRSLFLCALFLATPAFAGLTGLTTETLPLNTLITNANASCPNQPFFVYSGGDPDNFADSDDPAYPSPNLAAFMASAGGSVVDYDGPMLDDRFGDSFNLQNGRSVCYALIRLTIRCAGSSLCSTDGLSIGQMDAFTFHAIAGISDPDLFNPGPQTYSFTGVAGDGSGVGLDGLSMITGGPTPVDSILDIYLQDDAEIDSIRLWVWYNP
jgi:hypothetical protein